MVTVPELANGVPGAVEATSAVVVLSLVGRDRKIVAACAAGIHLGTVVDGRRGVENRLKRGGGEFELFLQGWGALVALGGEGSTEK